MRIKSQKGKRIRASDTHLLFQFFFFSLFNCWLLLLLPFHLRFLLSAHRQLEKFKTFFLSSYSLWVVIISGFVVAVLAYGFYRYRYDSVKERIHRQKLARMVLENGWYVTKQVESFNLFEDAPSKTKDKISYFPKIYYRLDKGLIHIQYGNHE